MLKKINQTNILITGGTGFLGRNLIRDLTLRNINATVLTRDGNTVDFGSGKSGVNLIRCDLLDIQTTRKIIERLEPRTIIHLAGSTFQADVLEKINYEATVRLIDTASAVGVGRFIMIGTADEYGFQISPQRETMAAMPVSAYAVSKNKAVEYALERHRSDAFPVVVLRPFTIYGIGQPPKMFISQAVRCAVEGLPFEMSEGLQKRDALFVTDFVNAIIKTLTVENIEGEIFNVGSGSSVKLRDLAKKIWRIVGADEKLLKIGARPTNNNELHNTEADITKISEILGWKPQVSLDEGLKIFVEAVKNTGNER